MNFAHESPLPFEGPAHLPLRFLGTGDGAPKCVAKLLNFFARPKLSRQNEWAFTGAIGKHCLFEALQRPDKKAADEEPCEECRRNPHKEWKEQKQSIDCRDLAVLNTDPA